MRNLAIVLALVMVLGLTSGCTTAQKGAVIGGGIGAGTGAIWVHNSAGKLSDAEGTLVGMAAGGLVGALVGDALDECKTKKQLKDLNGKIDDLKKQVNEKDKKISDLNAEIEKLKKELADCKAKVDAFDGKIRFTILNEVLFDSGKDVLKADGKKTIEQVAEVIQKHYGDRKLVVEGHTDTDPIKVSKWKSNWELSAARSLAVVHFMIDGCKIAPATFSAQAFSEYAPVAGNDTKEGKMQNRRAVITVMPANEVVKEREK